MPQNKLRKVLIVGCGDLGMRLAQGLSKQGWELYGLRRHWLQETEYMRQIVADVTEPCIPEHFPQDLDYVVYCVAANQFTAQRYKAVYVDGLRHVLAWVKQQATPLKRLIFVSSTGVYGQAAGQTVNEGSATEPTRWSGQIMLEAEQLLAKSSIASSVVRLSGIYGPNRERLIERAAQGFYAESGHLTNRIHIQDAANFLQLLLEKTAQNTSVANCYLVNDDLPVELKQVLTWLRQQLGTGLNPANLMPAMAGSKYCDNSQAKALGWQPQYSDYRQGYAPLLEDYLHKNRVVSSD